MDENQGRSMDSLFDDLEDSRFEFPLRNSIGRHCFSASKFKLNVKTRTVSEGEITNLDPPDRNRSEHVKENVNDGGIRVNSCSKLSKPLTNSSCLNIHTCDGGDMYGFTSGYMQRKRKRELMDSPGLSRLVSEDSQQFSRAESLRFKRTRLSFGDHSNSAFAVESSQPAVHKACVNHAEKSEVILSYDDLLSREEAKAEAVIAQSKAIHTDEERRQSNAESSLFDQAVDGVGGGSESTRGTQVLPQMQLQQDETSRTSGRTVELGLSSSPEASLLQSTHLVKPKAIRNVQFAAVGEGSSALKERGDGGLAGGAKEDCGLDTDGGRLESLEHEEDLEEAVVPGTTGDSVGDAVSNSNVEKASEHTLDREEKFGCFPVTGEDKFAWCRNVVRQRLNAASNSRLQKDIHVPLEKSAIDANGKHLEQLIESCLVNGLSSSVVLVGDSGTGKHHTLSHVLEKMSCKHRDNLVRVHLSGQIHTDDVKALREITRQLSLTDALGGVNLETARGSFSKHLDFLLATLGERSRAKVCVVFVLDDFVHFAKQQKQLLLYNLLDLIQSKQAYKMMVIGITERLDVVEQMEKRIKSRFEDRQVFFPSFSAEDLSTIIHRRLHIPTDILPKEWENTQQERMEEYISRWNQAAEASIKKDLDKAVRMCTDDNLGAKRLLQVVHSALLETDAKFVEDGALPCKYLCDKGYDNLRSLTHPELTLVASMVHLERRRATESYNFEMVYAEMLKFFRFIQAPVSLRRPLAMKAFERLLERGIIVSTNRAVMSKLPRAFRHYLLKPNPESVSARIKSGAIRCPTNLQRWIEQTFVI